MYVNTDLDWPCTAAAVLGAVCAAQQAYIGMWRNLSIYTITLLRSKPGIKYLHYVEFI